MSLLHEQAEKHDNLGSMQNKGQKTTNRQGNKGGEHVYMGRE